MIIITIIILPLVFMIYVWTQYTQWYTDTDINILIYTRKSNLLPVDYKYAHPIPNVFYNGKEPLQIKFKILDHLQNRKSNYNISVGALDTALDETLQVHLYTVEPL